jgi:hypothetical protein
MDETQLIKIVAAVLASQAIMVACPTEDDPTSTVVDVYKRILAELRSRGHGIRPEPQPASAQTARRVS